MEVLQITLHIALPFDAAEEEFKVTGLVAQHAWDRLNLILRYNEHGVLLVQLDCLRVALLTSLIEQGL